MDNNIARQLIDELKKANEHLEDLTRKTMTETEKLLKRQTEFLRLNINASELLGMDIGATTASLGTVKAATETLVKETINSYNNYGQNTSLLVEAQRVASEIFKTSVGNLTGPVEDLVPVVTANSTKMAIFQAGLEKNSKGIGKFIARSELLGEDIEQMSFQLRGLTQSVGLSNFGQTNLAVAIANSAKTYNTSTSKLLESMTRLASVMAVANTKVNPETAKLFAQIQGMTDRLAPDALETALGPLMNMGAESIRIAGTVGVADEMRKLQQGQASVEDIQRVLRAFVDLRETFVTGSYEGDVIGAEIVSKLTTLDVSQIEMLGIAEEAIEQNKNQIQKIASLGDAQKSLQTVLAHMSDIGEALQNKALVYLERIVNFVGAETLAKLSVIAIALGGLLILFTVIAGVVSLLVPLFGLIVGVMKFLFTKVLIALLPLGLMAYVLYIIYSGISGLLRAIPVIGDFLADAFEAAVMGAITTVKDMIVWAFGQLGQLIWSSIQWLGNWILNAITSIMPAWMVNTVNLVGGVVKDVTDILDKLPTKPEVETEKNTRVLADVSKKEEFRRDRDRISKYAAEHASILASIIRSSTRQDLGDDMLAVNAYAEQVKQNAKLEALVDGIYSQNELIRLKNLRWGSNSSGDGK